MVAVYLTTMPAVQCGNRLTISSKESKPTHTLGFIYMWLANHKPTEKKFVTTFHISLAMLVTNTKINP
jgi:hypothetical protein